MQFIRSLRKTKAPKNLVKILNIICSLGGAILALKTVLAISSDVGVGGVGLSIMRYVFAAHDINQICLPTVLFASRPDLGRPAKNVIAPGALRDSLEALEQDGQFSELDGVITGYFADQQQIDHVAMVINKIKQTTPKLIFVLDPVFGDIDTGLYVDEQVAVKVIERLLPLADVITPNRFEFYWTCERLKLDPALILAGDQTFPCRGVVVTSGKIDLSSDPALIDTILLSNQKISQVRTRFFENVPKGTGDIFSAELTAQLVKGNLLEDAAHKSAALLEGLSERAQNLAAFEPFQVLFPNKIEDV